MKPNCGHCGRVQQGSAAVNGMPVCHTGELGFRPPSDCYRLITIYGEKPGIRRCKCPEGLADFPHLLDCPQEAMDEPAAMINRRGDVFWPGDIGEAHHFMQEHGAYWLDSKGPDWGAPLGHRMQAASLRHDLAKMEQVLTRDKPESYCCEPGFEAYPDPCPTHTAHVEHLRTGD